MFQTATEYGDPAKKCSEDDGKRKSVYARQRISSEK